jgi:protein TonB
MNIKRYTLPVIVAAGLHGALFLGSRTTSVGTPHVPPPVKPTITAIPIEDIFVAVPEDRSDVDDEVIAGARNGEVLPELPDLTDLTETKSDFAKPEIDRVLIKVEPTHNANIANRGAPGGVGEWERGVGVPKVFSSSELDRTPHARVQAAPRYPATMSHLGITGTVVVEFDVNTDGNVVRATAVTASHTEFVEPALRAVRSWKFSRGLRNGRPVSFRMRVPIEFGLDH